MKQIFLGWTILSPFIGWTLLSPYFPISCVSLVLEKSLVQNDSRILSQYFLRSSPHRQNSSGILKKVGASSSELSSEYLSDNSVLRRNPPEKSQNSKKLSYVLSQITIKASIKVEDVSNGVNVSAPRNVSTEENLSTAEKAITPGNNRELTVTEAIPASVESDDKSESTAAAEVTSTSTTAESDNNESSNNAEGKDEELPVTESESQSFNASNNNDESVEGTIALRHRCNLTEECRGEFTECRSGFCKCRLGFLPSTDDGEICGDATSHHTQVPRADPTMIGVVVGLVLMSVTMCIVLRLFARARFKENRTIFNTANPRLMNASLVKVKGKVKSRRGSLASVGSGGVDVEAQGSSSRATPDNPAERRRTRMHKQTSTDSGGRGSVPPSRVMSRSNLRQDSTASHPYN